MIEVARHNFQVGENTPVDGRTQNVIHCEKTNY